MRALTSRTVTSLTSVFVALALAVSLGQGGPSSIVVAGVASLAIATLVAVRFAVLAVTSREMTVGSRAHAHREALSGMPAPQHPSTPGRPRTRAPSAQATAA